MNRILLWRAPPGLWTAWFSLLNAAYLTWVGCLKLISTTPDFSIAVELLAGACLFAYRSRQGLRIGALLASIVYAGNLLYLLTAPAWLADMGGFPFLGSGQGTIKYIPMLATTLYLLAQTTANPSMGERHAAHVGWAGIVLVMGWIGAMKFFPFEAEGIEPLLRGHWVFDWMYGFWDIQGVSNIIGTVELLFAVTLVAGMVWEKLMPFALAGIAVTVACTTSFMFTLPGWAPDAHFPLLNGSGVFLLKDQFLLAAMLLVCGARNKSTN